MSTKLQTASISIVALGIGSFLLVLAAQRADEINFAAVAKLLGLATGFVLLAIVIIAGLALLSQQISSAIGRRLRAMRSSAKETASRSGPFLIVVPIVLVFFIETQAAESGNLTGLARIVLAVTAISGALSHMKFNNSKIRWRATSFILVLAAPLAFWSIAITDKVSIATFDPERREGLLANGWDYLLELAQVSTNIEVAAAAGTIFLLLLGILWVVFPFRARAPFSFR